jgi:hypothetical protein
MMHTLDEIPGGVYVSVAYIDFYFGGADHVFDFWGKGRRKHTITKKIT